MLRILAVLAALATTARAEPAPEETSYHGEMVLADIGASALVAGGLYLAWHGELRYLAPGALAFATAGPIVHALHGNGLGAARSALLRIGLPFLGGMLWLAKHHCPSGCDNGQDDNFYAIMGALGGELVAVTVDNLVFAHAPAWTPVVAPMPNGGVTLGLGGAF